MKWLFFSYSLPTEPSKARVYVWRQLKKLGAVNCQSSWVLPHSRERIAELNKLSEDIKGYAGESLLVEGKTVDAAQEEKIKKVFTASRSEEYQELIEKCEDFFKEINFEIERKNFIFAEVEENEEELEKLKQWLKKIEKRDVLGVPLQKAAAEKIKTCEKMFDDFAKTVYLHTHKGNAGIKAAEKIKKSTPKGRK